MLDLFSMLLCVVRSVKWKNKLFYCVSVLCGVVLLLYQLWLPHLKCHGLLKIMYVDLESAGHFGNDFKVDIDEGQHQIVVRFNKLLRSGGDTQKYQSEPIVLDLQFEKNTYFQTLKAPYIDSKAGRGQCQRPTIYDL